MLRFLFTVLITFFITACGVDTSSSTSDTSGSTVDNPSSGDNTTGDNTTVDDNTTSTVDDNITVDDNTTVDDDTPTNNDVPDTAFDYVDAIEDPNACSTTGYRVASDASYDGSSVSENGASGLIISEQGLVLRSEYLSQENDSTWVTLFYKGFPTIDDLNLQGVTSYKMDGVFYISYDIAWSDESIPDVTNTMYLQSNKDEVPDCYRLDLNNTVGSRIGVQKVYRLRQ